MPRKREAPPPHQAHRRVIRILPSPVSEASALPAPSKPAVTLNQVTKVFGRFAALREVTAQFQRGRVYAIFGENGAGKSTLLRIIAGLTKPTRGAVEFDAADAARREIGYMAHASMLYDELSGMENLRYFGGLYGLQDATHFADFMRQVGLDSQLARRVGDYSQGMRQRLSLARAIMHDPAMVLLDEPFSNLDATSSRHIAGLLSTMSASGKCVLVVTHQAGLLEGVADESLLISRGQVVAHAQGIAAGLNNNATQEPGA